MAQTLERNRGRIEARTVEIFPVRAEEVCFPHALQAARLWRAFDEPAKKKASFEEAFLLSSHSSAECDAATMLSNKRGYWSIESGLHQRLDCSAYEDKSRVRNFNAAWNLGMFRRLATSLAIHWMQRQTNPREATLTGFFDAMRADHARKAFSLVTANKASWLP